MASAPRGLGFRRSLLTRELNAVSLNRIPASRAVRVGKQWWDSKTLRELFRRDPSARNPLTRQPFPAHVSSKYGGGRAPRGEVLNVAGEAQRVVNAMIGALLDIRSRTVTVGRTWQADISVRRPRQGGYAVMAEFGARGSDEQEGYAEILADESRRITGPSARRRETHAADSALPELVRAVYARLPRGARVGGQ